MSVVAGGAGMGGSDDGDDREKKNINPQSCHSVKRSRTEDSVTDDDDAAAAKRKFILEKDDSATSVDMNNSDHATSLDNKRPLVPFTNWGKLSSDVVMRGSLETQHLRRQRSWPTPQSSNITHHHFSVPPSFDTDEAKVITKNGEDHKDEASSKE